MNEPLEETYFKWLYGRIADSDDPYWSLALQLHKKEFLWFVPNDDNRIEDGRELRYDFAYTTGTQLTPAWHSFPVSTLEVLIGLAIRLEFQLDESLDFWFWQMIDNLNLMEITDDKYDDRSRELVDETLDTLIWRTYLYSGEGGLFPLEDPQEDQRKVELWYQMSAYVIERL
jgi:hypothetical protein